MFFTAGYFPVFAAEPGSMAWFLNLRFHFTTRLLRPRQNRHGRQQISPVTQFLKGLALQNFRNMFFCIYTRNNHMIFFTCAVSNVMDITNSKSLWDTMTHKCQENLADFERKFIYETVPGCPPCWYDQPVKYGGLGMRSSYSGQGFVITSHCLL